MIKMTDSEIDYNAMYEIELNEAEKYVKSKLNSNDMNALYSLFITTKILTSFLDNELYKGNNFAKSVDNHLKNFIEYIKNKKGV